MIKPEKDELTRKLQTNLARARTYIRVNGPYFLPIIMKYVLCPCWNDEVMKKKIRLSTDYLFYFDPIHVANMNYEELGTTMVHGAHHSLMQHPRRAKHLVPPGRPRVEWLAAQLAEDLSIDYLMLQAGWKFPQFKVPALDNEGYMYKKQVDQVLLPEQFGLARGLTFEEYHLLLLDKMNQNPELKKQLEEHASFTAGDCGEITGDPGTPEEQAVLNRLRAEYTSRDQIEIEDVQKSTLKNLVDADLRAGKGSSPWGSYLKALTTPSVMPWEQLLHAELANAVGQIRAGQQDYSWQRPSRRSFALGLHLPGLIKREPRILFAIDVSYSMSDRYVGRVISELVSILQQLDIEAVDVVQLDTKVLGEAVTMRSAELSSGDFTRLGRGGTNFDDLIRYAAERSHKIDLLFVATDGGGEVGLDIPPGLTILWGIIGEITDEHMYLQRMGKTGRIVRILDPKTGGQDKIRPGDYGDDDD